MKNVWSQWVRTWFEFAGFHKETLQQAQLLSMLPVQHEAHLTRSLAEELLEI